MTHPTESQTPLGSVSQPYLPRGARVDDVVPDWLQAGRVVPEGFGVEPGRPSHEELADPAGPSADGDDQGGGAEGPNLEVVRTLVAAALMLVSVVAGTVAAWTWWGPSQGLATLSALTLGLGLLIGLS